MSLLFERDPDQSGVPAGFVAYVIRWWTMVYTGNVERVDVVNGLPHLTYFGASSAHLPNYLGELSRVYVKDGSPIDPAVFELQARPLPKTLEECHPRYPDRKNPN